MLRNIYEGFAQKDIPRIVALFDPAIEITQSTEVPWGGTYSGYEGALQFFTTLTSHISSVVTIDHYVNATENVVAVGWTRGTVKATGATFEVPIAHVWTLANGLARRVSFLIDNPTMVAALSATH